MDLMQLALNIVPILDNLIVYSICFHANNSALQQKLSPQQT